MFFTAPYTCDNGYDTTTGQFISYCVVQPAKYYTTDNVLVETQQFHMETNIRSFQYGFRVWDPIKEDLGCTPMDRMDTDTIYFQVYDGFSSVSYSPSCLTANNSPNLNVQCNATGPDAGTTSYGFLQRQRPPSLVQEPPPLSSSSQLLASFALVCIGLLLGMN